jgi:hypothetical protein
MKALLIAGDRLIQRLKVLHAQQLAARERGEIHIELPLGGLIDGSDLEAIQEWERAKALSLPYRGLLSAGDRLLERLKVLHALQTQARERGEDAVELHVGELIETSDLQAIQGWDAAKAEALGHQVLPMGAY